MSERVFALRKSDTSIPMHHIGRHVRNQRPLMLGFTISTSWHLITITGSLLWGRLLIAHSAWIPSTGHACSVAACSFHCCVRPTHFPNNNGDCDIKAKFSVELVYRRFITILHCFHRAKKLSFKMAVENVELLRHYGNPSSYEWQILTRCDNGK